MNNKIKKGINYHDGYEYQLEYDNDGNPVHYKDTSGYEEWQEYNEDGLQTYYKNNKGVEEWQEYNEDGQLIHYKNSGGMEYFIDYIGNKIITKDIDGNIKWVEYKR